MHSRADEINNRDKGKYISESLREDEDIVWVLHNGVSRLMCFGSKT
jgi:hypothetical protein